MFPKVVPLDEKHNDSVKLFMFVHYPEEVSWIPSSEDLKTSGGSVGAILALWTRLTDKTYLRAGCK